MLRIFSSQSEQTEAAWLDIDTEGVALLQALTLRY